MTSLNDVCRLNQIQTLKEKDDDLNLMFLIMKSSPLKYDAKLVNNKFKKLNEFYSEKQKVQNKVLTNTDAVYYKYNILYGTKSNELIRSYSPKMRPQTATLSTMRRKDGLSGTFDVKCFNEEEVKILFLAKCNDLIIKSKENLERKFKDYCDLKCINRNVDFSEVRIIFVNHLLVQFVL